MAVTVEDLDRRVTALERAAETEKNIVRAVSEVVAESERRMRAEMSGLEKGLRAEMSGLRAEMSGLEKGLRAEMSGLRAEMSGLEKGLRAEMKAEAQRLTDRISASERRMIDTLNDRFDAVMVAIDRRHNPPG